MLNTEHAANVCALRPVLFVFLSISSFCYYFSFFFLSARTKLRYQLYLKLFRFLLPFVTVANICYLIHNNVSHYILYYNLYEYISILYIYIYILHIYSKQRRINLGAQIGFIIRLSCGNFSIEFLTFEWWFNWNVRFATDGRIDPNRN